MVQELVSLRQNIVDGHYQDALEILDELEGSVIAEQIRTLDLSKRWWKTMSEILPSDFVDRVVKILAAIIG